MLPVRHFRAAKAALVCKGRVLMLREAGSYVDGSNTGRYDLPGGRLAEGEDLLEGLKREVIEETGLRIEAAMPFHEDSWQVQRTGETWQIDATFFVADVPDTAIQLSRDHDHAVWIDPAQPGDIPLMKNYPALLAKLA